MLSLLLLNIALPPAWAAEPTDPIARIREEGLNHSQIVKTLTYLTEVIGPRLTGSPEMKRANEWTKTEMASWGLTNAHLESWGPFGRGWSLKRFSAQVIEPCAIPLIAYPKAWSPGFDHPFVGEVLYLGGDPQSALEKFEGRLKGAIVLLSPAREIQPRFEPLALRLAETNLLRLANAAPRPDPSRPRPRPSEPSRAPQSSPQTQSPPPASAAVSTNAPRPNPAPDRTPRPRSSSRRILSQLMDKGAAMVVSCSGAGDGGILFSGNASVTEVSGTNRLVPLLWATNCPPLLPQITMAAEDYNRLIRLLEQGEKVKMAVDFQVQYQQDDPMAYNTIAEIPGGDLKRELVMLGGHLDSVQVGTGATDNAAGVAVVMEAARIIKTLGLQPRRTIRVALWSGEEQGYLGSRAYVNAHFGYYTNATRSTAAVRSPRDRSDEPAASTATRTNSPAPSRTLVRQREYDRLSCYFNLDNGTGKIRGVYMQGNEGVRGLFRSWLQPFRDLQAETLSSSNTSGTDHIPFDAIGLPGFQFIQDPIEYWTRTHHSTADVYDRLQIDDLKQAATIIAAFAYNAAMLDEKLPRKPLPETPSLW